MVKNRLERIRIARERLGMASGEANGEPKKELTPLQADLVDYLAAHSYENQGNDDA